MSRKLHYKIWHGALGKEGWKPPVCVSASTELSRQDQGNDIDASEYIDHPEVLEEKMELLATLLRKSKYNLCYTGAGISRGAGIPDYASAKTSVMNSVQKLFNPMGANPTFSHCVLANLEKNDLIDYYVNQNHDGLPQKAGFKESKMNDIHGAWFDPSNPVVQFYGHLRGDLFKKMIEAGKKADLVLCMGTSLSGMNADRVVQDACKRFYNDPKSCIGSVIVNLQLTPVDIKKKGFVSLRVWAKIDDAMKILIKYLEIEPKIIKYPVENDIITCPYDENGKYNPEKKMILDLSVGAKIIVCRPDKPKDPDCVWDIIEKDEEGHYQVYIKRKGKLAVTRRLGRWWMNSIKNGELKFIPLVNENPKFEK